MIWMAKKNTKWDLVWILPEIIGGLGVLASALWYLSNMDSLEIVGTMMWIFHVVLVVIVLKEGLAWTRQGTDELTEVFKK